MLDALRVGPAVGWPELPNLDRYLFPDFRPDGLGRLVDVAVTHAGGVAGNHQTEEPIPMRERVVRRDAAARGRGHHVELSDPEEFNQIVEVLGSDSWIILGGGIGVVIVPP